MSRPIKPNLIDYFIIAINVYTAIFFRGTWVGWVATITSLFFIGITVFALLTGDTIVGRDDD